MSTPSVNFIGCGKLGLTLATLIKKRKAGKISGIVNSHQDSATAAKERLGQGTAYADIASLKPADITFITTQDDNLLSVVEALAASHAFKENAVVCHCSGALSTDVLSILKAKNIAVASVHPVRSFANIENAVAAFKGTHCAIEGDDRAKTILTTLFEKIGGVMFPIEKSLKTRYHAASVMANNYLTTLHYHATLTYLESGIDPDLAKQLTSALMQNSLNNLETLSHQEALTGPLKRNDQLTISTHLRTLSMLSALQMTKALYAALLLATLPLTSHSETLKKEWIHKTLNAA